MSSGVIQIVMLLTLASGTAAGQDSKEPRPVPGHAIATWQTIANGDLIYGRVIKARNDTTVPLDIIRMHLSKCVNIAISCDAILPSTTRIAPGRTAAILTVHPYNPSAEYSFSVDLEWRPATGCTRADDAAEPDSVRERRARPELRQIIIPQSVPWAHSKGAEVGVTFFVGTDGGVDSTNVTGITDREDLKKFQTVMKGYQFIAGTVGRCPVPGTYQMHMTLGH